ncbi:nitric oxide synthase oxygenase, partial [Mammaliicoccus sciuri]
MLRDKATAFINNMYKELEISELQMNKRIQEIEHEISQTGTYTHTTEELEYGAKVAWRNSNRCIGRLFWDKLTVRDLRHIQDEQAFITSIESHIKGATNDGKIKPMISIYNNQIEIMNEQLIRYAGYEDKGDPKSIEMTKLAHHLNWQSQHTDFDVLPLMYRINQQSLKIHQYPQELIKEININHKQYPKLASLQLKWYAVPIISNMDLEIGGIYYHTA